MLAIDLYIKLAGETTKKNREMKKNPGTLQ